MHRKSNILNIFKNKINFIFFIKVNSVLIIAVSKFSMDNLLTYLSIDNKLKLLNQRLFMVDFKNR